MDIIVEQGPASAIFASPQTMTILVSCWERQRFAPPGIVNKGPDNSASKQETSMGFSQRESALLIVGVASKLSIASGHRRRNAPRR